jgi:hypothetical protein
VSLPPCAAQAHFAPYSVMKINTAETIHQQKETKQLYIDFLSHKLQDVCDL